MAMLYLTGDLFGRKIRYPLPEGGGPLTAGSLPENDLYFPYRGVSRKHFVLECPDGRWRIRDLESRNGVMVNGKRVKTAILKPDCLLQIGVIRLKIGDGDGGGEWLSITEPKAPPGPTATDETGTLEIRDPAAVLAFPDLVFPPEYIPGGSPAMLEIYRQVHALAGKAQNILLIGETGTGKEMLARTLHLSGPRPNGPFIAVNCAAVPVELAEAELFGIGDRVATGVSGRRGRFALAHGGTLFLDELSAFPMAVQAKILRVIEEKIIHPVGIATGAGVDFRLISATNQDPRALIDQGRLREDLYHRLAGVEITLPPLRERREDIEGLILGFLHRFSREENKPLGGITKLLLARLIHREYSGNVRELSNVLGAMVTRAYPGEILDADLLPTEAASAGHKTPSLHETLEHISKARIQEALRLHDGNITRAARHLGVSTVGLRKMMKRMGISKDGM